MSESTETPPPDDEVDSRKLRERWAPLGLVLFGGFWNFFVGPMGDAVTEEDWWVYPVFALLGSLMAQPMLCAVWGAWSTQPWIWRLPLGLAACVFLSITSATHGDVLNMLVGMLSVHLLLVAVLALIRWRLHFVLTAADGPSGGSSPKATFGIGYLFLWMTVAAVLAALGRMIAFGTQNWDMGMGQMASWMFAFSLLLAPPAWLLAYLLRSAGLRLREVMAIVLSVPLAVVVPAVILLFETPITSFWTELHLPLLFICAGAMVAVAVVAAVLRWAGYRIYGLRS